MTGRNKGSNNSIEVHLIWDYFLVILEGWNRYDFLFGWLHRRPQLPVKDPRNM